MVYCSVPDADGSRQQRHLRHSSHRWEEETGGSEGQGRSEGLAVQRPGVGRGVGGFGVL